MVDIPSYHYHYLVSAIKFTELLSKKGIEGIKGLLLGWNKEEVIELGMMSN